MNLTKLINLFRLTMQKEPIDDRDIISFYIWTKNPENASRVAASADLVQVRDMPVSYFLKVIFPGLVCNVDDFIRSFKRLYKDDDRFLLRTVVRLNRVFQKAKAQGADCGSLDALYSIYEESAKTDSQQIAKDDFLMLYKAVNYYWLDTDEINPECIGYGIKDLHKVIKIVNELQLSRSGRIDLVHNVFCNPAGRAVDILDQTEVHNFISEKDQDVRQAWITEAELAIGKMSPMDVLGELTISKGKRNGGAKGNREHYYIPNDVSLENGLCYSRFIAVAGLSEVDKVAVFFPTPFFVRKMMRDKMLRDTDILFVLDDEKCCEIIKYYYDEGSYEKTDNNAEFISFDTWLDGLEEGKFKIDFQAALYFGCDADWRRSSNMDKWLDTIIRDAETVIEVFALIGTDHLENQKGAFYRYIKDAHIWAQYLYLIPQGIQNACTPQRKMLAKFDINPEGWTGSEEKTYIYKFDLNCNFKRQALTANRERKAVVGHTDIVGEASTVRHLLAEKLLEKKGGRTKRKKSERYPFTPDINVWFTTTEYDSGAGTRVEAYVCEPTPDGRVERGFRDKGKLISPTKKITTKIQGAEIYRWLEEVYPFSEVRPRRDTRSAGELIPQVSIRESVIAALSPVWRGSNIALKTLWYALPEMQEILGAADYDMLSETVRTDIGSIRVQDIEGEAVERGLIGHFPAETQGILRKRFRILSMLLDVAIKQGYVDENLLAELLRDRRKYDKLFGQVRSGLVKKHLIEVELLKVYSIIKDKLETGDERYLGLLIRLLYGLESNIVCGLQCGDVYLIEDYDLFKIIVTRQITNDGKKSVGFDHLEDYRSIPCTPLLRKYIERRLVYIETECGKEKVKKMPLIPAESGKGALTPQELSRLCRDVINELEIDPLIISIPTVNGGRKETNLNAYGGDFFRENFRYWTRTMGLSGDELAYVMGNKPETTLGRHYVDFSNDASQDIIAKKINRWHSMLEYSGKDICREIMLNEGANHFQMKSRNLMELDLKINLKRGNTKIRIASLQGMTVKIAPVETLKK